MLKITETTMHGEMELFGKSYKFDYKQGCLFFAGVSSAEVVELLRSMADACCSDPRATTEEEDYPRPTPHYERTPQGAINNCALNNGVEMKDCQICGGDCPERPDVHIAVGPEAVDEVLTHALTHPDPKLRSLLVARTHPDELAPDRIADPSPIDRAHYVDVLSVQSRLQDILLWLHKRGHARVELTKICEDLRPDVPVLRRISNLAERIARTLETPAMSEVT